MTVIAENMKDTESSTEWFIQSLSPAGGQSQRIPITNGRFQIGRRSDLQLCLPHSSVSKLHAELVATEVALFVRDLGSTNGTFVNGKRITDAMPISERDILHFAEFEFAVGRSQHESAMRTMVSSSCEWRGKLAQFHQLLAESAVVPYFQPIINFADRQTIGYEVLARSTVQGLSNPQEMFGAAEHFGMAARLSILCRENGVNTGSKLRKPAKLFLNTHPTETPKTGLIESLTNLRSSAPDTEIVVELHEAAVTNSKEIAEFRAVLRDLNMQLAYDDFGSGQARLVELSEVAPDYLKFDIGLIRDIHLAPTRQQVVASLVQIVRDLGIYPLAECIETPEEAEVCRQIGFTFAQGYLYGKPVPLESLVQ